MKTFERPEAPNVAFPWLQIRLGGRVQKQASNFSERGLRSKQASKFSGATPPTLFTAPPFVQNGKDPLGVQGNPLGK